MVNDRICDLLDKGFILYRELFPTKPEAQAEALRLLAWYRIISRLVIRKRISVSHALELLVDLLNYVPRTENVRCCCIDDGGVTRGMNGRVPECHDVVHGDLVISLFGLTG